MLKFQFPVGFLLQYLKSSKQFLLMHLQNQVANSKHTYPQTTQFQLTALNSQLNPKHSPINIVFKNISYQVQIQKKTKHFQLPCLKEKETKSILKNVSGVFKAGELSAILGASGAGKTSLLNIIACRAAHTQGKLYANRKEYNYDTFGDFANYVMQSDVLMQTLTVKETLHFAADLKLNNSKQQKDKKVSDLAKSMKLQNCLDVQVGGQLIKGISGGEKKRTSIAFELISDPQVIMLDQPTSGLDSLTSFIIVDYLSRLAQRGRTVLMTIHQPNTDIYRKFDRLFLMVEGKFVYQGAASQAISYFSSNFGLNCGQFVNPAEFQIQIVHPQDPQNVKRYPQYFKNHEQKQVPIIQRQIQDIEDLQVTKRQTQISTTSMFCTLVNRDFINITRNPMLFKSRLIQSIVTGIYIGGVFFDAGRRDYTPQTYWFAIIGFFFFLSISALMFALAPVTLIFPIERAVFLKEENSRLYTVLPYFLSRNVIEIPYLIVMPLVFNLVFYWMMGLASTAQQFFMMYFITFLINLCGNSLGLLLGSIIQDAQAVSAAVPIVLLPFVLFSGLFKNTGNLPDWLGWIQYVSPLKYGYIALVTNEVKYKASRIDEMNFDTSFWGSIGLLIALSFGYRLLSLFFLWLMRTKLE